MFAIYTNTSVNVSSFLMTSSIALHLTENDLYVCTFRRKFFVKTSQNLAKNTCNQMCIHHPVKHLRWSFLWKKVNVWKLLTIFTNSFILDFWQGSE